MVIYDKNQFTFNIIFTLILLSLIGLNLIYTKSFYDMNLKLQSINQNLSVMESKQDFNFLQAPHNELEYYLTTAGFYVPTANDYGRFSGPSMQPAIFDGNLLLEKKYDGNSTLKEGQIVRFIRKQDGEAVIHRVRADYGNTVFVQGDSLPEGEIIEKGRITHVVVGVLFT
jgi:hypothetical protein